MKNLTLTKDTDAAGESWLHVRLDGVVIKSFEINNQAEALRFFNGYYLGREGSELIAQRVVTTPLQQSKDQDLAKFLKMTGKELELRTVMTYRGYRILDRPYGRSPYTIVNPEEGILPTIEDDDSLKNCLDTIDELMSTLDQEADGFFVMPAWRKREIQEQAAQIQRDQEARKA